MYKSGRGSIVSEKSANRTRKCCETDKLTAHSKNRQIRVTQLERKTTTNRPSSVTLIVRLSAINRGCAASVTTAHPQICPNYHIKIPSVHHRIIITMMISPFTYNRHVKGYRSFEFKKQILYCLLINDNCVIV